MNHFQIDEAEERYHFEVECANMERRRYPNIAQERRRRRTPAQRAARAIWRCWLCVQPFIVALALVVFLWACWLLIASKIPAGTP